MNATPAQNQKTRAAAPDQARPWAIRIDGIGKQYRYGSRGTPNENFREDVMNTLRSLWRPPEEAGAFWALKDINLEIQRGETVGIIGRNGAGKSTLLKILSRITPPTEGTLRYRGRLASLLEVGTGFHRELTGRENIYLNGAILGMRRSEIARQFDAIVDFAGVEKFVETPVKFYSSGMYVRLAFAVAAHLNPEILIVDEVLAVGDAEFQKKCLGRMGEVAREGRTVLFVSHNMQAVTSLCRRAILLDGGRVAADGPAPQVLPVYLKQANADASGVLERNWPASANVDRAAELRRVALKPCATGHADEITMQTPMELEVDYWSAPADESPMVDLVLYTLEGFAVMESLSLPAGGSGNLPVAGGLMRSSCRIPGGLLNQGVYRLRIQLLTRAMEVLHNEEHALTFEVFDVNDREIPWYGRYNGLVHPRLTWTTTALGDSTSETRT